MSQSKERLDMTEEKCAHLEKFYSLGNTYCKQCRVWLHAGLPNAPEATNAGPIFREVPDLDNAKLPHPEPPSPAPPPFYCVDWEARVHMDTPCETQCLGCYRTGKPAPSPAGEIASVQAEKNSQDCGHDNASQTHCPDCGADFVYCAGCSEDGAASVYHMPPACAVPEPVTAEGAAANVERVYATCSCGLEIVQVTGEFWASVQSGRHIVCEANHWHKPPAT